MGHILIDIVLKLPQDILPAGWTDYVVHDLRFGLCFCAI
jgi:hypothetical protein